MPVDTSTPPLAALGPTPRIVVEGLMHRGELASLEIREARVHAATTGIIAGLAAALILLGGFAGTFAMAAAVWHRDDRGFILALTTLAYLAGAAALGWWAVRRIKSWHPLAESRRQVQEDFLCLHQFLTENGR
jgi:uncharacterized membrane protein YqjE